MTIPGDSITADTRDALIGRFLNAHGLAGATRAPLAGDASARRYERLTLPDGTTRILTDTPDPAADLIPFIAIGRVLERLGLSVPRVLAADTAAGLAVQEDFGDDTFTRCLDRGDDPAPLYALATDALIQLHRGFTPADAAGLELPLYDAGLFVEQVMLFADAYIPLTLGRPLSDRERNDHAATWMAVVEPVCAGPRSLLLRDYHMGNLMRVPRDGVRAAGLIDFQGAGLGPVAYDLMSLVEDARRDVPDDLASAIKARYLDAFPALDRAAFHGTFAVLGAVRHARVIGIFARLAVREGRRGYLVHMPRLWRLLERALAHPDLAPVAGWFGRHLPPPARAAFAIPETD